MLWMEGEEWVVTIVWRQFRGRRMEWWNAMQWLRGDAAEAEGGWIGSKRKTTEDGGTGQGKRENRETESS